jgi:predicted HTH transcriptional regulator
MKTLTDTDHIHTLIAEGEHQQQDFKFEISDARKIAKTLSAFANTDGGRLLIGVKDNGRIAGVRSEEEKYMIEAAAQLYCIPEIDYTLQTYIVEGKQVLVATIEENPHKPVYATKTESLSPISASRMRIYWLPLSTCVYGNKVAARGEN